MLWLSLQLSNFALQSILITEDNNSFNTAKIDSFLKNIRKEIIHIKFLALNDYKTKKIHASYLYLYINLSHTKMAHTNAKVVTIIFS